ncbi:type VI secretion system baseplate subunit TssG [uncultured Neptuniibacter sp.]|uniref:type VI secretion system baseplate subunit TssG n=1 Tax=uncultured Neptuniibacter sp. TaxID=502143 RepID=UPI0032B2217C
MEDTARSQSTSLTQALQQDTHQFDFYQAVRLLEKGAGAKVGYQGSVAQERVRFAGHPTMAFATSDLAKAKHEKGGKLALETNFFGLYGASSPLPVHITEAIIAEQINVESQDHQVYFISHEEQLQRLRDYRLDISTLLLQASSTLRQVKAGTQSARIFSEEELARTRLSESLEEIIGADDYRAFRQGDLLLQLYEAPAARQRDFLDLFNHRLTSLLYRSWWKYQPGMQYQTEGENDFSEWMFALMGAPNKLARDNSAINWPQLMGYAGLMGMNSGSASAMTAVISGYFDHIPVFIEEYVERWADIPQDQLNRLGQANSELGMDLCLGRRVKDYCGKFRVKIGPLAYSPFQRFLPDGQDYKALLELIDVLMPEQLCFDIELILKGDCVPAFGLGKENAPKLGWVGWLGKTNGADQSVFLRNI